MKLLSSFIFFILTVVHAQNQKYIALEHACKKLNSRATGLMDFQRCVLQCNKEVNTCSGFILQSNGGCYLILEMRGCRPEQLTDGEVYYRKNDWGPIPDSNTEAPKFVTRFPFTVRRKMATKNSTQKPKEHQTPPKATDMPFLNKTRLSDPVSKVKTTPRPCIENADPKLREKARKLYDQESFLETYLNLEAEFNEDVAYGKQTLDEMQLKSFNDEGDASAASDLEKTDMLQLVDVWVDDNVLKSNEAKGLKAMMNSKLVKKSIRDTAFTDNENRLVFGIIGYAQNSEDSKGTLLYAFRKFRFEGLQMELIRDENVCILNNAFCKPDTTAQFGGQKLDGRKARGIAAYVRYMTLQMFKEENEPFIEMLQKEAKKYSVFLC